MGHNETAASLLDAANRKFQTTQAYMAFLEKLLGLALKDALAVIRELRDPELANARVAQNAALRAANLISVMKLAPVEGGQGGGEELAEEACQGGEASPGPTFGDVPKRPRGRPKKGSV